MYRYRVAFHFGSWWFAIYEIFDGTWEQIESARRGYATEELAKRAAVRRIRRIESLGVPVED